MKIADITTKTLSIPPLVIASIALSLLRIWVSWLLGNVVLANDSVDSQLMVNYSNVFEHFGTPSEYSLVKSMSYPIFLLLPSITGISYNVLLSILWLFAGAVCVMALKRVSNNRWFLFFSFLFITWSPIAFDLWAGIRVYRNAVIAPAFFVLFGLLFLFASNSLTRNRLKFGTILVAIFAGLSFLFCYYLKEDGFWMLLVLGIVTLICIAGTLVRAQRNRMPFRRIVALFVIAFLPFAVFQIGTLAYKEINFHYFGVKEINTRTEGALGTFVKNVYEIKSDARTKYVWAPYDAIEKAFDASETLHGYPELENSILNTTWFKTEGGGQEPITGDFLGWVLRTSLTETGLWENEAQVQAIFEKANEEIEQAFSDGTLEHDQRIILTSSAGSRTIGEIIDIADDTVMTFLSPICFQGYDLNIDTYRNNGTTSPSETERYIFNQYTSRITNSGLAKMEHIKTSVGSFFANTDLLIYRLLAPLLFFVALFGSAWSFAYRLRRKIAFESDQKLAFAAIILLLLLALVYAFGISWFSEFIYCDDPGKQASVLTFYGAGITPMIYLASLFGAALLMDTLGCFRRQTNEDE